MFAFTKRYIEEEGNLLLTNGVDVTEVNKLNQSVNTEKYFKNLVLSDKEEKAFNT